MAYVLHRMFMENYQESVDKSVLRLEAFGGLEVLDLDSHRFRRLAKPIVSTFRFLHQAIY